MRWSVRFLNERVKSETLSFPPSILANFLRIAEMIETLGPNLGRPHTESMGDGLFEIRAKGREGIGRSIFCYALKESREIVILHSFVKKSQKTPKKELNVAKERYKELKNE